VRAASVFAGALGLVAACGLAPAAGAAPAAAQPGDVLRSGGYPSSIRNGTAGATAARAPAMERAEPANQWPDERWESVDDHWWWRWYGAAATGRHFHGALPPEDCTSQPIDPDEASLVRCGSIFYRQVYVKEDVRWVEVAPPVGVERRELPGARSVEAGGLTWYLDGFTFYEKLRRGGREAYVSVAAPVGAGIDVIPPHALALEIEGLPWYQYDSTFYRPLGPAVREELGARFVVASPPPAP
jgi:hypothetical protein